MEDKITFILNTGLEEFKNHFTDSRITDRSDSWHTALPRLLCLDELETDDADEFTMPMFMGDEPGAVFVDGYYTHVQEDGSAYPHYERGLFWFNLIPLTPVHDRLEVRARCRFPDKPRIYGYFCTWLREIAGTWPEAGDSVARFLAKPDGDRQPKELEPWEKIPDHLWDRLAIEMWCKGHTNQEIAPRVNVKPLSVTNRIVELRKLYPKAEIPTDEQRRKLTIWDDTG